MRKPRFIRQAKELKVAQGNYNGGSGTITIGGWTGSVVWGDDENGMEHVSVSPYDHSITPSWDDMCRLKDIFFDEEERVIQIHPKRSEYVNMMGNCLHLWRPKTPEGWANLYDQTV